MTRTDSVLNMQITIANCMKQEWNIDFSKISDLLDKYGANSIIGRLDIVRITGDLLTAIGKLINKMKGILKNSED